MSGMPAEAITQWRAALSLSGEPEQAQVVEETFAASGFDAAVRALARKQWNAYRKTAHGQHVPAYHYMMACMRLGDTEQAFSWMKKTVEEPSWFALQLRVNPLLDPLRSDPRFEKIVADLALKQ